ncbi:hypothetical protein CHS0354_002864 [Potamilus streckersoni]|uniref:C-type lectin domain-containing protein n=1 Tax=Potamilus streckersoni TaxID=2493646 RepID=A0AAE0SNJ6_9BIVA|nr:hypothetical protein CHS0354_002864 [Potamilus streckersoni]
MDYTNVTLAGSYFCIKVYSSGGTFRDAMKICESEKAKLLAITTQAQIADLTRVSGANGIVWAYIGISDEASEGQWVSWDGSAVNLNWKPGEPSNTVNQNCAFASFSNYYVVDMSCNEYQPFICHKKWL